MKPVRNNNPARQSWGVGLNNLRKNISHCRPEAKDTLVNCFLWCVKYSISRFEFAQQIGHSDNVIYKIITGTYTNPDTKERLDISDKMLASMKQWLDDQRAHQTKRAEFVLTPTANKVLTAVAFARESRTPVFLFGPSHIGKTWALEHASEMNNHGATPYYRMRANLTYKGLVKLLAGIGVAQGGSIDDIKERVFDALTRDTVPVLDEMHELLFTSTKKSFFSMVEFIRELHDVVGCGLVMSFTDWGRDRIQSSRYDELNQIFRRGVHRFQLPKQPLVADLKQILDYHGLEFPSRNMRVSVGGMGEKPYDLLRQLGREQGLKSITERIRYAKKIALKSNRDQVTWEDLIRAHFLILKNAAQENDWE